MAQVWWGLQAACAGLVMSMNMLYTCPARDRLSCVKGSLRPLDLSSSSSSLAGRFFGADGFPLGAEECPACADVLGVEGPGACWGNQPVSSSQEGLLTGLDFSKPHRRRRAGAWRGLGCLPGRLRA